MINTLHFIKKYCNQYILLLLLFYFILMYVLFLLKIEILKGIYQIENNKIIKTENAGF